MAWLNVPWLRPAPRAAVDPSSATSSTWVGRDSLLDRGKFARLHLGCEQRSSVLRDGFSRRERRTENDDHGQGKTWTVLFIDPPFLFRAGATAYLKAGPDCRALLSSKHPSRRAPEPDAARPVTHDSRIDGDEPHVRLRAFGFGYRQRGERSTLGAGGVGTSPSTSSCAPTCQATSWNEPRSASYTVAWGFCRA
jgi:hypothetical protein